MHSTKTRDAKPANHDAGEVRALWVVRTTLDHPDSIMAMINRAHDNGFNTLIVQVRGRGDAFYNARWEPRAESIKDPAFDPLAFTIKEAHKRGIAVHAWLNTELLANMDQLPTDPRHIYHARPDLIAVPYKLARELYAVDPHDPVFRAKIVEYSKGARDHVEGLYMVPAAPETKEHIYSIWMDVLEHYDVDGLNFDYVRYPAPDYDYSRTSIDRFRMWLVPQLSDSVRTDTLRSNRIHSSTWIHFRRSTMISVERRSRISSSEFITA